MIYGMSDFHLYNNHPDKDMAIFGQGWEKHMEKIISNWPLKEDDIIIMPGDLSWALKENEVHEDLKYIDNLPGKKILLKGNHDLWWGTSGKMKKLLADYPSIDFIINNSLIIDGLGICGTRGWDILNFTDEAQKIIAAEVNRLRTSILTCEAQEKIVFMHYPPILQGTEQSVFLDVLKEFEIKEVYYGHLHGSAINNAIQGYYEGINFKVLAADQLNFIPIIIR